MFYKRGPVLYNSGPRVFPRRGLCCRWGLPCHMITRQLFDVAGRAPSGSNVHCVEQQHVLVANQRGLPCNTEHSKTPPCPSKRQHPVFVKQRVASVNACAFSVRTRACCGTTCPCCKTTLPCCKTTHPCCKT